MRGMQVAGGWTGRMDAPQTGQPARVPEPGGQALASGRIACRPRLTVLALLLTDLAALTAAHLVAVHGYLLIRGRYDPALYWRLWPALLLFLLAYDVIGLYHGVALYPGAGLGPAEELRRGSIATTTCYILFATAVFLAKTSMSYSRGVFLLAWLLSLAALPSARAILRLCCARRRWWGAPCLIYGSGSTAQRVLRTLIRHPDYGLRPVAMLAPESPHGVGSVGNDLPVLRDEADAARLAARGVHYIIAAVCDLETRTLTGFLEGPGLRFRHVLIVPPDFGLAGIWASSRCIETVLGLEIRQNLLLPLPRACKRLLDIGAAAAVLPIAIPAIAVIAALVRLTSHGPAFYCQTRLGRGGKPFRMWKFRTMHQDADALLAEHFRCHPEARQEWDSTRKLRHDPRVTPLGSHLRRLSLDELPQVWNLLCGTMSLVGPRPIIAAETERYGEIYALYKRVSPGLTGLWQVSGRNALPFPERVALDAFYVRNWSVWLDLYIVMKTLPAVISGEGAY